jgi:hypothetical protein
MRIGAGSRRCGSIIRLSRSCCRTISMRVSVNRRRTVLLEVT